MERISRKEARGLGLMHYFTGKPCKSGHLDKRYVSSMGCVTCTAHHRDAYNNSAVGKFSEKVGHLRRKYGMRPDEFLVMFDAQSRKCPICETELDMLSIHLDHDHQTGKPRAILCAPCNRGLGHFKDSPELLLKAAAYLKEHHENRTAIPHG